MTLGTRARFLATTMVIVLGVGWMVPVFAGEKKRRVIEDTYRGPAIAQTTFGYTRACFPGERIGCIPFELEPHEGSYWATVRVSDDSGTPIHAVLVDDDSRDVVVDICAQQEEPVRLTGSLEFTLYLMAGSCHAMSPSVPTSGLVELVVAKRRAAAVFEEGVQ